MIKSMTGYSYVEFYLNGRRVSISIKSLNNKFLEVNTNLPHILSRYESDIVEVIKSKINRGKIEFTIFIDYSTIPSEKVKVITNYNLLQAYIQEIEKIKKRFNINIDINLSDLLRMNNIFSIDTNDEKIDYGKIKKELNKALKKLLKMREEEGKNLYNVIINIIKEIEKNLTLISKELPLILSRYKKRLRDKIKGLIDEKKYEENRILIEVALLADKLDIREEIDRLKSHLKQLKINLKSRGPIGRKLEFLLQEMLRETNTIGSKISDIKITESVISIKENIDKLREQIRNIE